MLSLDILDTMVFEISLFGIAIEYGHRKDTHSILYKLMKLKLQNVRSPYIVFECMRYYPKWCRLWLLVF